MARTLLGARRRALLVTAVAVGAAAVVWRAYTPVLAAQLPRRQALVAVVGVWFVCLFAIRLRERRAWRRHVARTNFSFQGADGGYPPLQARVGGRTVTVTAERPGVLSRVHTQIATSVDAPAGDAGAEPILTIRHVGGGARGDGLVLDNPTLAERLVVTAGDDEAAAALLTTDVQAALMDLSVPAEITVERRRVLCRVPGTRLDPSELGACATTVVALAREAESRRV